MTFIPLAKAHANTASFYADAIPIPRIMMPPIRNTLLNKITELLEEVELHAVLADLVPTSRILQIIFRFAILLDTHDGAAT